MGVQSPETLLSHKINTASHHIISTFGRPVHVENTIVQMFSDNTNSSSSPTKKRKANDGRVTTDCAHDVNKRNTNDGGSFFSSWFGYFSGRDGSSSGLRPPANENNTTQLNRMEEMMIRMEEKLSTVSSLESRCEQLEKKCSTLETMLELTSKATKGHIDKRYFDLDQKVDRNCDLLADRLAKVDSAHQQEADRALKRHEFNEMMLKNQSWEYSAPALSMDDLLNDGYTHDHAEFLVDAARELRDCTTKMRRGEFPHNRSELHVEMIDSFPQFNFRVINELLPHWKEFAAALEQFTPAINLLPDNCESYFSYYFVQMNLSAKNLVKRALMGKPFRNLGFVNNTNGDGTRGGLSVDIILEIVENNKHLRKLEIANNQIGRQHIERLCSAVRNHPLVHLGLCDSFVAGDGDEMLASLLRIDELKLEKLDMSSNSITAVGITLLADFLATNPRLKDLDLSKNNLNDSDAALIANALRSNTRLRNLDLKLNNINDAGEEVLRRLLWDNSSLNAVADLNHTCSIDVGWSAPDYDEIFDDWNSHEKKQVNRGRKIYNILSSRNKTMSNAQHFGNIEVKILPNMLAAVHKYYDASTEYDLTNDMYKHDPKVEPLSIAYEIMRKWDKVFPLYKSLGVECVENEEQL